MIPASAAALSAFALVAMAAPAAQAGECCMTNTSEMRGCGYATIEQCQASAAGGLGTCGRDPYFANPSDALPNNALAYQRSLPTREASFVRQSNRLSIDRAVVIS
jgi:hypothetical protein